MIVTTVYDPTPSETEQAKEIAAFVQFRYIQRGRNSLATLRRNFQSDTLIVASESGPILSTPSGELFFHLGMAALRIKSIRDGKPDHMAVALGLNRGMSVLDCTLGLGTDAIVTSLLVGEEGRVTGLEAGPLIAFITGWGLSHFTSEDNFINAAMRRINVKSLDYGRYLQELPDRSVDVVYFDPMFRRPVHSSSGIRPLREFARNDGLKMNDLRQACRVARQRVVLKETKGSQEFSRLGICNFVGGKYSSIQYGIIVREGG